MQADLDQILIDRDRIARRVSEMAAEIAHDLDELPEEGEVVLVPILTGSIIFLADLIGQWPVKMRMVVVTVVSYPGESIESRGA